MLSEWLRIKVPWRTSIGWLFQASLVCAKLYKGLACTCLSVCPQYRKRKKKCYDQTRRASPLTPRSWFQSVLKQHECMILYLFSLEPYSVWPVLLCYSLYLSFCLGSCFSFEFIWFVNMVILSAFISHFNSILHTFFVAQMILKRW